MFSSLNEKWAEVLIDSCPKYNLLFITGLTEDKGDGEEIIINMIQ